MRKLFFAIVLVAASFAGGAVINGPGLHRLQALILKDSDGEIEVANPGETAALKAGESAPLEPIPAAPLPPLFPDSKAVTAPPRGGPKGEVKAKGDVPPPATTSRATPEPKAPEPPNAEAPEAITLPLEPDAKAAPTRRSREAQVVLAKGTGAETLEGTETPLPLDLASEVPPPSGRPEDAAAPPRPEATPATAPPAAEPGRGRANEGAAPPGAGAAVDQARSPSPGPAAAAAPKGAGDWAEVRRKMTALGVARYGIEGEPGGRVRFHCVIPLAGQRAVGQQFEAEGDDEWQAIDAALRRIALWRATEAPDP